MSIEDIRELRIIENLNHIWIIHDGKHFDAATPGGVTELFDLRLVRQVAVELVRRSDPSQLDRLVAEHRYWQESAHLFEEHMSVRRLGAENEAPVCTGRAINGPSL